MIHGATRGADGSPGSVMRMGNGVPSNSLGVDGDYYMNNVNCDMYNKIAGVYVLVANIKGDPGIQGIPGTAGTNGTNGTNGVDGIVPIYTAAGLQLGTKMWIGTATTNSSGLWSANFASAGFTVAPSISAQAISSGTTPTTAVIASNTAPSTTTVAGLCSIANPVSLLGILPLQTAGAGIVVQIIAIGK